MPDTKAVVSNNVPPETVTDPGTVRRHSWQDFRKAGFLWLVNRTLHLYGWAIVLSFDDDTGELVDVYPARCEWRGFSEETNALGFSRIHRWMTRAGRALAEETQRPPD